jgi:epsilon-lactone hydrolase
MPDRRPSIGMRVAHGYLRRTWLQRIKTATLDELREDNRPDPPRRVARVHQAEPVQIGGVRCVWLDRANTANGVLVYFHGGGFLWGPLKEQWAWLSLMARRTNMACLLVDYRKAPEHPHPAAVDDALSVIRELQAAGTLTDGRWAVAGDSAGGNLAVSSSLALRDAGEALPARLVLLSPWMDVSLTHEEIPLLATDDPMLWLEGARFAGTVYAWEQDMTDPSISPVYADPTGLPPILLQSGTAELLAPDIRRFHQRCLEAGVDITYEEYRGAFHVFPMALHLPESRRALRRQVAFLRQ